MGFFYGTLGLVWRDGVAFSAVPPRFVGRVSKPFPGIRLSKIRLEFPSSCPYLTHVTPEIRVAIGHNSREAIHDVGFILFPIRRDRQRLYITERI